MCGTLDEDAYDQGDWEEKQSHWSRQRLHMDQNVINPTCCKAEWPLHYLVRTICYLKSWNYGLYGLLQLEAMLGKLRRYREKHENPFFFQPVKITVCQYTSL